jgi:general stress protein 26
MSDTKFWDKAHAAATKATWAYLATAVGSQPKVRVVHPGFEGQRVWVATGRASAKARHIDNNPKVELFYQVGAPEMIHLTVTGKATFVEDPAEKKRIWNGKVFDYDLSQFFPGGPESKDFGLMLIEPDRVELTSLPEMTTGKKPEVWRASGK